MMIRTNGASRSFTFATLIVVAAQAAAFWPVAAQAANSKRPVNDFPTQARVEYVLSCMKDSANVAQQEMLYKCTCAVDEIASRVKYDDWTVLATFANASSIAGERGTAIRDRKDTRALVTKYRETVARANQACFIGPRK